MFKLKPGLVFQSISQTTYKQITKNNQYVEVRSDDGAVAGRHCGTLPHPPQQLHQLCHLLLHWLQGMGNLFLCTSTIQALVTTDHFDYM
jgi:hypothetical protein